MTVDQLIEQAEQLRHRLISYRTNEFEYKGPGARAQVGEFLREYAGSKSSFFKTAQAIDRGYDSTVVMALETVLEAYVEYLRAGLARSLSPERQAQLDVVSDYLEQAQRLLDGRGYHPAAAAVLIGASLEEFLRAWFENEDLSLGNSKPGIDAYTKVLRSAELISKQDVKDITAWAGIRNHAAHGEWDEVSDVNRIHLMLEGVNLFMRKHSPGAPQSA